MAQVARYYAALPLAVGLAQYCSNSIFGHFEIFTKTDRKISNTSVQ